MNCNAKPMKHTKIKATVKGADRFAKTRLTIADLSMDSLMKGFVQFGPYRRQGRSMRATSTKKATTSGMIKTKERSLLSKQVPIEPYFRRHSQRDEFSENKIGTSHPSPIAKREVFIFVRTQVTA